jgi:hypothetical protein
MKFLIKVFLICIFLFGCNDDPLTIEKPTKTSKKNIVLFKKIKSLDSLFFEVAYNKCDSITGRKHISKDFEFYHDKVGALLDEPDELASDIMVEDLSWICNNTFRRLIDHKMEVYPLYEDNELYGAIQIGDHQFYKVENNIPTELISNAKFIHLWILEDNDWKLKRVLSFDHQK